MRDYIRREQINKRKNTTAGEVQRVLLREGADWLDRPVSSIDPTEVNELLEGIRDGAAKTKPRPYLANRAYAYMRTFFAWCAKVGINKIDRSPMEGLDRPWDGEESRDRVFTNAELKRLWKCGGAIGGYSGAFIKLLLLTGLRLREVTEAKWSEINLDEGELLIEDQRTKMGRPQLVPLSTTAREIVEGLPRFEGPYIFSTTSGARPVGSFSKAKLRADSLSGVKGWRIHDLRRTVRTGLAALGINDTIAERILGHSPTKLVQTYNVHQYRNEKSEAVERWAMRLREILEPPPENVVKLAKP